MFGKMARGAVLLVLAVMVVAWAWSASKTDAADPAEQPAEQPVGRMYS